MQPFSSLGFVLFDKRIGKVGFGGRTQALPDRDQQPTLKSPHRPGLVLVSVCSTHRPVPGPTGRWEHSNLSLRLMHPHEKATSAPPACARVRRNRWLWGPLSPPYLVRGCSPRGPPARATLFPLTARPSHPASSTGGHPHPCPGVCTCLTAGGPPKEGTVRGRPQTLFPS